MIEEGGNPNAPQNYDVVIVGSGGAGLAAAIQAHDEGARVVIIEKMPTIGGNTIKASVGMNAAETRFQKLKGIEDSKELFYEETLKGGQFKNNPVLLREFVELAPEAIEWLANHGIELNDITITGGMSIDRTHRPADRSAVGGFLISGLVKNINSRNIEVLLETSVSEILYENGAVAGVRVVDEYNDSRILNAKSVIVATGGFSANRELVVKYRPELDGFVTTNHKGATGSGIAMLEKLVPVPWIWAKSRFTQRLNRPPLIWSPNPFVAAVLSWSVRRVSASTTKWKPAIKSRRRLSPCQRRVPGLCLTSRCG